MNATPYYSHIAQRTRQLRKARNWNQAQLAKAAGVSQQTVSTLESQTTKTVRLDTIYRLAGALHVCPVCLQCQDVDIETLLDGSLCRLVDTYIHATPSARDWINQVAAHETAHSE